MTKLSRSLLSGASVFALTMTGGSQLGGIGEAYATHLSCSITGTVGSDLTICNSNTATTFSGVSVTSNAVISGDLNILTGATVTDIDAIFHSVPIPTFMNIGFTGTPTLDGVFGVFVHHASIAGQLVNNGVVNVSRSLGNDDILIGIGVAADDGAGGVGGGVVNNGSVTVAASDSGAQDFVTAIGIGQFATTVSADTGTSFFNALGATVDVSAVVKDVQSSDSGRASAVGAAQLVWAKSTGDVSADFVNHGQVAVAASFSGSLTVGTWAAESGTARALGVNQVLFASSGDAEGNVLNGGGTMTVSAYAYERAIGFGNDVTAFAQAIGATQDIDAAVEGHLVAANDGVIDVDAEGIAHALTGSAWAIADGVGVDQNISADSGLAFFTNNQVTGPTTSTGVVDVVASAVAIGETAWA